MSSAYDNVILAEAALEAFFKLNDIAGPTAVDSSSNAFNGTIAGDVTLDQAPLLADGESSMLFGGVSGNIQLPAGLELPAPLSVEFWFKSPAAGGQVFAYSGAWFVQDNTDFKAQLYTNAGLFQLSTVNDFVPNTVYYCVLTIDASFNFNLYVASGGGPITLWGSGTAPGSTALNYAGGPTPSPVIGQYSSGFQYSGNLEKVAFYNQALTPLQMQTHYNAGLTGPLNVSPTVVNIDVSAPSVDVTVQQMGAGAGAFSVTGGNPARATAILSSPNGPGPVFVAIDGISVGTTTWTVNGAGGLTQTITVNITSEVSLGPSPVGMVYPSTPLGIPITGGLAPYTYVGSTNAAAASGVVVGNTLVVTANGTGNAVLTVMDANGDTASVFIAVTLNPNPPPFPFVGPESQFPFKPQASLSTSQSFAYDIVISEAYPGIQFQGTEPNEQYQEIREVSGDLWLVTNAQFNTNTLTFQQNSPCNPADPAYAWRLMANGNSIRYSAVATTAPNINVTWVQMFEVDGAGNINSTPLVQTTPVDNLQLEPIWNVGTPTTTGSFEQDVTDTSSAANSFLEKFKVNGTVVWQVRKDGTLVNGMVPFSAITGFVLPANPTFTGTATFTGPVVMEDGLTVTGGENVDALTVSGNFNADGPAYAHDGLFVSGGLTTDTSHVTGNEQVDGNINTNGTLTGADLVLTGAAPVVSYVGEIVTNIAVITAGSLGNEGIPIPRANPAEGWNLDISIVALGSTAGNPFTFTFTAATFCTGGPFTTTLAAADVAVTSGTFTATSTANNTTNIPSIHVAVSPGGLGKVLVIIVATRVS